MSSDATALTFIHARIQNRHNEDPSMSFLTKLKNIIDALPPEQDTPMDTLRPSQTLQDAASMHGEGQEFLLWIYFRLVFVYKDTMEADYMCKLLGIARSLPSAL